MSQERSPPAPARTAVPTNRPPETFAPWCSRIFRQHTARFLAFIFAALPPSACAVQCSKPRALWPFRVFFSSQNNIPVPVGPSVSRSMRLARGAVASVGSFPCPPRARVERFLLTYETLCESDLVSSSHVRPQPLRHWLLLLPTRFTDRPDQPRVLIFSASLNACVHGSIKAAYSTSLSILLNVYVFFSLLYLSSSRFALVLLVIQNSPLVCVCVRALSLCPCHVCLCIECFVVIFVFFCLSPPPGCTLEPHLTFALPSLGVATVYAHSPLACTFSTVDYSF